MPNLLTHYGPLLALRATTGTSGANPSLLLCTPSHLVGVLRTGARMLLTNNVQVDASAGYLSFAQNGLDVWESKLRSRSAFETGRAVRQGASASLDEYRSRWRVAGFRSITDIRNDLADDRVGSSRQCRRGPEGPFVKMLAFKLPVRFRRF